MGHYSSSPRNSDVVLHHVGGPNTHTVETNDFCVFDGGRYDFAVTRQGRIFVCANSSGNPMWQQSNGAHGGAGCNSWIGIVMHGCFGGCASGNVSEPSEAQECAVAYLMSHLESGTAAGNLRPHAGCASNGTVCPGANFTSGSSWNSTGQTLRDRIRSRRSNWDTQDCCFSDPQLCPV